MQAWLTRIILAAFLAAVRLGRRKGYAYLLAMSDGWREEARRVWWAYKLRTLLSQQDPDDDLLADALGRLWKFKTPPPDSGWARADDGRYVPGPGTGWVILPDGRYGAVV
jgi:hypothetical protein